LSSFLFSEENAGMFLKEKKEIKALKQELNSFYNKKEEEYQKRQSELKTLLNNIEKEKKEIEAIYQKNMDVLNDIEGLVASKTTKVYNGMKPKIAASIFNKMIIDGKIEDVFDIILKLKEKKVTLIMKFLSVENASLITQMLQNYKINNSLKDDNG
jgi:flagellar motility protein MotE (MotC chaperone)